jgi:hypothetical protein
MFFSFPFFVCQTPFVELLLNAGAEYSHIITKEDKEGGNNCVGDLQ